MRLEYRATKHEHLAYQAAIQTLATQLHGDLVLPHDQDYMTARRVWNGAADRYPTVIARCADAADVRRALAFARSQHLPVAVRSGGHSIAGHSTCDDGLVIDLAPMKAITIDPATRIARVEPGVTWGEVAHHALAFGLALTSGDMAAVGVGGLHSVLYRRDRGRAASGGSSTTTWDTPCRHDRSDTLSGYVRHD